MQAQFAPTPTPDVPLQILLFVDKRISSREQVRQVQQYLATLQANRLCELQIVDVGEQPYLAEHFRLVATPTLIKVYPEPFHTLTGSDLVEQLHHWIPQWQKGISASDSSASGLASGSLSGYQFNPGSASSLIPGARVSPGGKPIAIVNTLESGTSLTESAANLSPAAPPRFNGPHQHETHQNQADQNQADQNQADQNETHQNQAPEKPSTQAKIAHSLEGPTPGLSTIRGGLQAVARSTELIQLSDQVFQLRQEKENLENQLKLKDQIIAMLAHDLRNPLTATSIALETLEMGHDIEQGWSDRLTPKLTAQLLHHARTQTRTIDRMVTDILETARGNHLGIQLQPEKLDLCGLCREAVELLRDKSSRKALTLEFDLPQDIPIVLADGERVLQVLMNLLDNAIKYTPQGGHIIISVLHRTSQKVQVSIADTGPGIPPENRDRIFEDHFRLERDASQEGYGIGLSLCQRIIRAHYGKIWVDPMPNQGSCFHFTLPVFKP